jgi:hypothetical protein
VSLDEEARWLLPRRDEASGALCADGQELVGLLARSGITALPLKTTHGRTSGWIIQEEVASDHDGHGGLPGVVLVEDGRLYTYTWYWKLRSVDRPLPLSDAQYRSLLLTARTSLAEHTFRHADGGAEFSPGSAGCVTALIIVVLFLLGLSRLGAVWIF